MHCEMLHSTLGCLWMISDHRDCRNWSHLIDTWSLISFWELQKYLLLFLHQGNENGVCQDFTGKLDTSLYELIPVPPLLLFSSTAVAGCSWPAAGDVPSPGCVCTQNPLPGSKRWQHQQGGAARGTEGGAEGGAGLSVAPPGSFGVAPAGGGASRRPGSATEEQPAVAAVWARVQGRGAHLLLQVTRLSSVSRQKFLGVVVWGGCHYSIHKDTAKVVVFHSNSDMSKKKREIYLLTDEVSAISRRNPSSCCECSHNAQYKMKTYI